MKKIILILFITMSCFLISCSSSSVDQENKEPDFIELISYVETVLEDITGFKVTVSTKKDDWSIKQTGLRYVLSSPNVKFNEVVKDVIIKLEFEDETYAYYKVIQLKIDNKNIDL